MGDAAEQDVRPLHEDSQARVVPRSGIADGTGLVIEVRVALDGSSHPAQRVFGKNIQEYAERLATESTRQEFNGRAPGANSVEITESAVIRAEESLEQQAAKRNRTGSKLESAALAGSPIFSCATGVAGSYLTNTLNWATFGTLAIISISCVFYLLRRNLL